MVPGRGGDEEVRTARHVRPRGVQRLEGGSVEQQPPARRARSEEHDHQLRTAAPGRSRRTQIGPGTGRRGKDRPI